MLELNASDERGIDVVRNRIKAFAQKKVTLPPGKHKVIILDEADAMTDGAQQARAARRPSPASQRLPGRRPPPPAAARRPRRRDCPGRAKAMAPARAHAHARARAQLPPSYPPPSTPTPPPPRLHRQALRRTMEIFSSTTRFALACNISEKIIEPIQSRCAVLRYSKLTDEQVRQHIVMSCC